VLVKRKDFDDYVFLLSNTGEYGVDTETTGLMWNDRLFSVIISTAQEDYYFNFNPRGLLDDQDWMPISWAENLGAIFSNPYSKFFIHNAKFDMRMLAHQGIHIKGQVHDTLAVARMIKNNHMSYSLDSCAKRDLGIEKDDSVEEYIKKQKLWEWVAIPGKKKRDKIKYYQHVPLRIMQKYGESDGRIVYDLGKHQLQKIKELRLECLYESECNLTKTCFAMEWAGIKIDAPFVRKAKDKAIVDQLDKIKEFEYRSYLNWKDSSLNFVDAFRPLGVPIPVTEKGNPSFNEDALKNIMVNAKDDRAKILAKLILGIRKDEKIIGTYYSSFLYYMDDNQVIHANIRQGGTDTGRFSYSDPNLQNIHKQDGDAEFPLRRSFVPRDGYCLTMIDYDQQEFRMMLDYAGELGLIKKIMEGQDVHQSTAEMVGISRPQAKTLNFGLLYGMGAGRLADQLNVSLAEAKMLKDKYFARLPKVKVFIRDVIKTGEVRGYIYNWRGRRYYIDKADFAYKLPNHLIQGGCADVIKTAMIRIHEVLKNMKSRMLIQVHDELVFEIHKDELDIVPKIKTIMENAYPPKHGMQLTCSVEHSWKSWADKEEGCPYNIDAISVDQRLNSITKDRLPLFL